MADGPPPEAAPHLLHPPPAPLHPPPFPSQLCLSHAASQSTAFKTRGRLAINLVAADFNNATGAWDNRATTGAFNAATNGDFQSVTFTAGRASKKIQLGGATGVNLEGAWGGGGGAGHLRLRLM